MSTEKSNLSTLETAWPLKRPCGRPPNNAAEGATSSEMALVHLSLMLHDCALCQHIYVF